MAKSQMYLTAATTYDYERDGGESYNQLMGRENMVKLPLWAAVTLMSPSQKSIIDDLLWHQAEIETVQIAMGKGFNKEGTLQLSVERYWWSGRLSIYISPRGKVTGMVWKFNDGKGMIEVKSYKQLQKHFTALSLYPATTTYREPFQDNA
tara:strand:+ start:930 stop:1379 length:450 start_codon:yes stop_codon:yes gene_type:complete